MPDFLWTDTETYSEVDIKRGTDNYSRAAQITLWQYALNDGDVKVWDRTLDPRIPRDLAEYWADPSVLIWAHNARFDYSVTTTNGYPTDVKRWRCSMAMALAHSLPGGLDKLCDIFGIGEDQAKLKDGKALVRLFCMPQRFKHNLKKEDFPSPKAYREALAALKEAWPGRATRETHPEQWERFKLYGGQDVEAMRAVVKKMPKWNYGGSSETARRETALWHLDQKMNIRGVQIDVDLVKGAIETAERTKASLAAEAQELTDGAIQATTQRNVLLHLLNDRYDLDLTDLRGATVERLLKMDLDLPDEVAALLRNRLAASSTSVSKYVAFDKLTGPDGRLRNTTQFCGAMRTGRDAGRGVQLQNLPRPTMKHKAIIEGIEAIKLGAADLIYDNPMELLSSAVRGAIIADDGAKLVVADLSNIEGRKLAWLAGEEWKLNAFRDFDTCLGTDGNWYSGDQIRDSVLAGKPIALKRDKKGEPTRKGFDLYALAYAKAFRVTPEAVMENKKSGDGAMRQIGKVMELACFGPNTQVVTNTGIKSITAVLSTDLLWDGVQWVKHRGVVEKGVRQVVNVAGIKVTPDHLVLTGRAWTEARHLATSESTLSLALATGLESWKSLGLSAPDGETATTTWFASNVLAEPNPTSSMTTTCEKENQPGVTPAPKSKPDTGEKILQGTRTFAPTTKSAGHFSTAFQLASTGATTLMTRASRIMAAAVSSFTNLGARIGERFLPTYSLSTGGTTPTLNSIGLTSTAGMNQAICDSSQNVRTTQTAEASEGCKSVSNNLNERMRTYDIAYAGPRNRFTVMSEKGPLVVHNCGYQGGVGAFVTFAIAYGINLDAMAENAFSTIPADRIEKGKRSYAWAVDKGMGFALLERTYIVCHAFVNMWRDAHPETVAWWKELENAFRNAVLCPGKQFQARRVTAVKDGSWVRLILPSGRSLCYPNPKLEGADEKISYMGISQFSRQWVRIKSYSGKLAENVTQASSRDVFKFNAPAIEDAGYDLMIPVHDEQITEAPDLPEYSSDHLAAIMALNPPWAKGLPLAAAGFEDYRYRKD